MKHGIVMAVMAVVCIAAFVRAQESKPTGALNLDTVPVTYIVKKGDTLWDISERFLGNPFDWPEVWKKNGFIVNHDLIYPGQTIRLKAMIKQVL